MKKFEDYIDIIDIQIKKHAFKWQLKAVPAICYEDIAQLIRLHIYNKWDKWDQNRPIEPWLNSVISNQIINKIRDFYGKYARPCIGCAANQGGDLCSIYTKQCLDCPLFAHWHFNRKGAFDIKLALPLENHLSEISDLPDETTDITDKVEDFHERMRRILTPIQYKFYRIVYIEGKSEDEAAELMGYITKEHKKKNGYRQIPNMKKIILTKAKSLIKKKGI